MQDCYRIRMNSIGKNSI